MSDTRTVNAAQLIDSVDTFSSRYAHYFYNERWLEQVVWPTMANLAGADVSRAIPLRTRPASGIATRKTDD